MNTVSKWLFTALFLVLCVSIVQGATIYSGANLELRVSDPIEVGTTPLEAITITAVGANGVIPSGFDGSFTTTGNALHQLWQFGGYLKTPTTSINAGDPIPLNLDSHFLVDSNNILPITPPDENRIIATSLEDSVRGGFGNSLSGTFSLQHPTSTNWDIAYLVVPKGTQINFNFKIGFTTTGIPKEQVVSSYTVVPEPSVIALITFGCIALLIPLWRRK